MTPLDASRKDVLTASDAALAMVLALRADEENATALALWIEVTGTFANAYTYDIYFQSLGDALDDDWHGEQGGLALVVPAGSVDKVRGSVLDVNPDSDEGGMFIENPTVLPDHPPRVPS